jgi:hypothetical protein
MLDLTQFWVMIPNLHAKIYKFTEFTHWPSCPSSSIDGLVLILIDYFTDITHWYWLIDFTHCYWLLTLQTLHIDLPHTLPAGCTPWGGEQGGQLHFTRDVLECRSTGSSLGEAGEAAAGAGAAGSIGAGPFQVRRRPLWFRCPLSGCSVWFAYCMDGKCCSG